MEYSINFPYYSYYVACITHLNHTEEAFILIESLERAAS